MLLSWNPYSIQCCSGNGPIFRDITLTNKCYTRNSCYIDNDGFCGYECHPQYKESLFINSTDPSAEHVFAVLDYEVFGIENYKDYISNNFKYPDIILKYLETKDISEESLKLVDNEHDFMYDLDRVSTNDIPLRLKLSNYFLKNPSEFLPDTHIVDKQYDSYLKEWIGEGSKWQLIYRASEHEYSGRSFHEHCGKRRPTILIIKSSEGWIFGGYVTRP